MLPGDIQEERERKARSFYRRNKEVFFGTIIYYLLAAVVVAFAATAITATNGCANPNMPWNRGQVHWQERCLQMTELQRQVEPGCRLVEGRLPADRPQAEGRQEDQAEPELRQAPSDTTLFEGEVAGASRDRENGEGSAETPRLQNETRGGGEIEGAAPSVGASDDFCEEMRADIENWRQYLNPDYDWSQTRLTQAQIERRVRYLRDLIEQWDRRCSS